MKSFQRNTLSSHLIFIGILTLLGLFSDGPMSILTIIAMLFYWRLHKWWLVLLVTLPLLSVTTFISQQGFIPYPPPALAMISVLLAVIFLLPYLLDSLFYHRLPIAGQLLLLPALANIFNLYLSKGPTGAMGYFANHLADWQWLMQWTSLIGIFGIGFLIYLLATTLYLLWEKYSSGSSIRPVVTTLTCSFLILFIGGHYRIWAGQENLEKANRVTVAAITAEQTSFSESLYKAFSGKEIRVSRELNQSDPLVIELSQMLMDFKDNADKANYSILWDQIDQNFSQLLQVSAEAVARGAKIIVLSEGEIITTKGKEEKYIRQLQHFSKMNEIYFFAGMGSLLPHSQFPPEPVIENKILVIGPRGEIADIYFKNVPVPDIDPSVPGDGIMRAIETPWGKIAYAICYDTDFPDLMRQVGALGAQLLIVPAGDWKEITPYHTKATNIRSIENGFSQVRAVSNGLSSAVDAYGNYLAVDDFFEDKDHLMISEVPMLQKPTLYTHWGEVSTYFSFVIIAMCMLYLLIIRLLKKITGKSM